MRREARARILRKRAESSAKKDKGKEARVIARAKRDCRVTDPRRQKLGSRLFHGERTIEPQRSPSGLVTLVAHGTVYVYNTIVYRLCRFLFRP